MNDERHETAIYDGQLRVGAVVVSGTQFKAEDAARKSLGLFTTRSAAAQAVIDAHKKGGVHA